MSSSSHCYYFIEVLSFSWVCSVHVYNTAFILPEPLNLHALWNLVLGDSANAQPPALMFQSGRRSSSGHLLNFFYVLIEGNLLCDAIMVSTIQQCKSAITIHLSPLSWSSLPSYHPIPLDHHRLPGWAPCVNFFFQHFRKTWVAVRSYESNL